MVGVSSSLYKGHRYPAEIISYCVWLYHRFPLSFREIEEMMMERGGSSATRRSESGAANSARTTPRACAVDSPAEAISGTSTRCSSRSTASGSTCGGPLTRTATCWISSPPAATPGPQNDFSVSCSRDCGTRRGLVVTDKLRSYGPAHRDVLPAVEHRSSKYLNNRAEDSHQPTRQRERAMKRFQSAGGANASCPASARACREPIEKRGAATSLPPVSVPGFGLSSEYR